MRLKFGDQNKKKKGGSVRGRGVWNEAGVHRGELLFVSF